MGAQHYQLHLQPQAPPGLQFRLAGGQHIPLLIERYATATSIGPATSTPVNQHQDPSSCCRRTICTAAANPTGYCSKLSGEMYAISSSISDAIRLKQLIKEIEYNISIKTFGFNKHNPYIVRFVFVSSTKFGSSNVNQQTNQTHAASVFVDSRFASSWATCSWSFPTENKPADVFTKALQVASIAT